MKSFELKGSKREQTGKKAAKAYRKELNIPCILYGGEEVVHFSVTKDSVRKLIYTPEVQIVDLTIGKTNYKAILKETQFHPVSDELLHADFLQIFEDKPVAIKIPVELTGLAEGVRAGGKLSLQTRKLKVKGLYKDFPEKLTVNVENLSLGKSIQVGDIHFDNLELLNAKNNVVATVKTTRAARGSSSSSDSSSSGSDTSSVAEK
ncbi:MAG: 50S ribosomal protein L25/general stress protein Ctc [Dysgonamonadaceae bacterium]|jgi:large subunit ribosomal protein L25|nr:50S ribosomal protein L25/general stress protein Ctc [Dysgonamonadaceae bacterium]